MEIRRLIGLALVSSGWGGGLSAVALLLASRLRGDALPTGINGPSHWFFGEHAPHEQRLSLKHTAVGLLTHQASSFFWGLFFAGLRMRRAARLHGDLRIAAEAAALTMLAAAVDLVVVPKRLTPGFERRLSARSLTAVYVAFGAGLAIAARRNRRSLRPARSAPARKHR